jgi:hypothetical protein
MNDGHRFDCLAPDPRPKVTAKPRVSKFAKLRGRATVHMKTGDILALTRAG